MFAGQRRGAARALPPPGRRSHARRHLLRARRPRPAAGPAAASTGSCSARRPARLRRLLRPHAVPAPGRARGSAGWPSTGRWSRADLARGLDAEETRLAARRAARRAAGRALRRPVRGGHGEGVLLGGCLSLLTASLGTALRAAARRRDPLLGGRQRAALSHRPDVDPPRALGYSGGSRRHGRRQEPVRRARGTARRGRRWCARAPADFTGPVAWGLPSGHGSPNLTLPLGRARRARRRTCVLQLRVTMNKPVFKTTGRKTPPPAFTREVKAGPASSSARATSAPRCSSSTRARSRSSRTCTARPSSWRSSRRATSSARWRSSRTCRAPPPRARSPTARWCRSTARPSIRCCAPTPRSRCA